MTIKDMNRLRTIEFFTPLICAVLNAAKIGEIDSEILSYISTGTSAAFTIDTMFISYIERLSKDHKELKALYDEVILRTSNFSRDLGLTKPVEIYNLFCSLYNSGLLSYKRKFKYNNEGKNLSNLMGIDVIRGSAVCRHISSFLCDVYRKSGYKSNSLSVYMADTPDEAPENIFQRLLPKKIANHQIASVVNGETKIVLDPTNMLLLKFDNEKNCYYGDDLEMYPRQFSNLIVRISGKEDTLLVSKYIIPNINEEESEEELEKSADVIKHNYDATIDFFRQNKAIYKDIYKLSNQYPSMDDRIFPFIKIRKK